MAKSRKNIRANYAAVCTKPPIASPKYTTLDHAVRNYFNIEPEDRILVQRGEIELKEIVDGRITFRENFNELSGFDYHQFVIFDEKEKSNRSTNNIVFYNTLAEAVEKHPELLNEDRRVYARQATPKITIYTDTDKKTSEGKK